MTESLNSSSAVARYGRGGVQGQDAFKLLLTKFGSFC